MLSDFPYFPREEPLQVLLFFYDQFRLGVIAADARYAYAHKASADLLSIQKTFAE